MSAPSTSGLSVELLLRVIDVKYGYFTFMIGESWTPSPVNACCNLCEILVEVTLLIYIAQVST